MNTTFIILQPYLKKNMLSDKVFKQEFNIEKDIQK